MNKDIIGLKLKMARRLINKSQSDIAELTGLSQRDISEIESGNKTFIPTKYIQYMNSINVDLNSIFDLNEEVCFQANNNVEVAKMTSKGYLPKIIDITLSNSQVQILNRDKLSPEELEIIRNTSSFHLCSRKDCVHYEVDSKKCVELIDNTCLVIKS